MDTKRNQQAYLRRGDVNAFSGGVKTRRVDQHLNYGELKQDSLSAACGR